MKRFRLIQLIIAASLLAIAAHSVGEVQSLRGSTDVIATTGAPDKLNFKKSLMADWIQEATEEERLTDEFVMNLADHASYAID